MFGDKFGERFGVKYGEKFIENIQIMQQILKKKVMKKMIGSEKILRLMSHNKYISINELAEITGISTRAVEKHIANLKEKGTLKRIGPDKGGHWEVIDES